MHLAGSYYRRWVQTHTLDESGIDGASFLDR